VYQDSDDENSLDHQEVEMFDMFEKLDISTRKELYDSAAAAADLEEEEQEEDEEKVHMEEAVTIRNMDTIANEKVERKADKKAQKAARRAQRQGLGDPTCAPNLSTCLSDAATINHFNGRWYVASVGTRQVVVLWMEMGYTLITDMVVYGKIGEPSSR
jgi:hypothetical protein